MPETRGTMSNIKKPKDQKKIDPSTPLRGRLSASLSDQEGDEAETCSEPKERTPYHGAAFGVFSCLFNKYQKNGNVALIDEHRLSKEPLRIDIVVIKKNRDIELEPVWTKIFREHNLVEYKSPADKAPTFEVFCKLMGYAWIYAAQEKVKISDMTVTIICARTPQKLFKILKEDLDYEILEKNEGIYYIRERGVAAEKRLAIQIMVQKSELLLYALDKRPLDEATVDKLAECIAAMDEEDRNRLGYWFKAIAPENAENISKRMGRIMTKTDKAYLKVMEELGYAERLRKEGRREGMQKGRQEGALNVIALLEKGYSLADAKKKLQLT